MNEFHTMRSLCLSRKTFTIVLLVLEATDGRIFTGEWSARHWVTGREYSFGSFAGQCSYDLSLKRPVPLQALSHAPWEVTLSQTSKHSRDSVCLWLTMEDKFEDAYAMDNNLLLALYDAKERLKDVKNSIQTTAFSTQD